MNSRCPLHELQPSHLKIILWKAQSPYQHMMSKRQTWPPKQLTQILLTVKACSTMYNQSVGKTFVLAVYCVASVIRNWKICRTVFGRSCKTCKNAKLYFLWYYMHYNSDLFPDEAIHEMIVMYYISLIAGTITKLL